MTYFCRLVLYIFQVFTSAFLLLPLSVSVCFCVCVNHTSTERSIQFLMGPPGLHSSSLLIFSCFPFCTPRGGDVSIGPGQWRRVWAIDKQIGDEGERGRKNERSGRGGSGRRGLRAPLITEALADPWPWSWPQRLPHRSEVVWKCHCGDSLHCWVMMILCSLPSLSDMISVALRPRLPGATHPSLTRPHKALLKAPCRQSQWAGGKGTQTEEKWGS